MGVIGMIIGFVFATGLWGYLAHKYPAKFAWLVDTGAVVVNKVGTDIKSASNTTPAGK